MSDFVYQPITVNVTVPTTQSANEIVVTVSNQGADVEWSSGPIFSTTGGISMTSSNATGLPFAVLSMTNPKLTCKLVPKDEIEAIFAINAFLVGASNITRFGLSVSASPSCVITASLSGGAPVLLGPTITILSW